MEWIKFSNSSVYFLEKTAKSFILNKIKLPIPIKTGFTAIEFFEWRIFYLKQEFHHVCVCLLCAIRLNSFCRHFLLEYPKKAKKKSFSHGAACCFDCDYEMALAAGVITSCKKRNSTQLQRTQSRSRDHRPVCHYISQIRIFVLIQRTDFDMRRRSTKMSNAWIIYYVCSECGALARACRNADDQREVILINLDFDSKHKRRFMRSGEHAFLFVNGRERVPNLAF